jgi:hypothetical protein
VAQVSQLLKIKTGIACVFAVVLVSFSLGCAQSPQAPYGRQYYKFVFDESLLANYPQRNHRGDFTREQLLIVGEFLEWMSLRDEGYGYAYIYVLKNIYTMDGSTFAGITVRNSRGIYLLLEVSGEGRTLKYTSVLMF